LPLSFVTSLYCRLARRTSLFCPPILLSIL
jgi:hypothetical protein